MKRNRIVNALMAAAIAVALTSIVSAMVVEMSDAELGNDARLVVTGTVTKVNSYWNKTHDLIYTDVGFVATTWHKKAPVNCPDEITVRVPGGALDGRILVVEDMPRFSPGEQATLYLIPGDEQGVFEVYGGWQGKAGSTDGYKVTGYKRKPASYDYWVNSSLPSDWRSAIRAAHNTWHNYATRFCLWYAGTIGNTAPSQDGYNVIYRKNLGLNGVLAVNYSWSYLDSVIYENDIVFNTSYWWTTNGTWFCYDVQNVATHEVGHSFQLDDLGSSGESEMTMYYSSGMNETKKRSLEGGDKNGINYLYDVAPIAPWGLVGSWPNSSYVYLNWLQNSRNEDGFKVERKLGTGGAWSEVYSSEPNDNSFYDYGVSRGNTYYYRVRAYNGWLYSGYSSEVGVYVPRYDGPGSGTEAKPGETPGALMLAVAPNPILGSARISYSLPAGGRASLVLYDASGRVAATLANGYQSAGAHESGLVNHGTLAHGVYLLKLAAGAGELTQKVLIK